MKNLRIYLTAGFMLMALIAGAQMFDRGNFLVGSTVGFSTAKSKITQGDASSQGLKAVQLNFAPNVGYFVANNFALGIGADYTVNTIQEPNEDETNDRDLLFGPFARLYFPMGSNVALFGVCTFGFGNSANDQLVGEEQQRISTNLLAVGAGPGLTVYSDGGFALEVVFKYNYATSKFTTELGGIKTSNTTKTNQFAISLGMQYYFGGLRGVRN